MNELFLLEIEDARALIKDMRGDPTAFDFQMQRPFAVNDGKPARCYNVVVELNGQRVLYQGGSGLDWVGHFEFDLYRGVFELEFNQ